MRTLGVDIGSLNVKAVCFSDGRILGTGIAPLNDDIEASVYSVMGLSTGETDISFDGLPLVTTGIKVNIASIKLQQKSITTCLARGIHHLYPSVRLLIDMGAESTTVIKLNERGRLADWANHDKCASGTGLFLQQMAKLMDLPFEQMSQLSAKAKAGAEITNTCAVFAESEVISHIHRDPPTPMEDVVAGIYYSVVSRVSSLCKRVGIEKDVAVSGGVALNQGLLDILEQELNLKVVRPDIPQIIPALGAAIIAREKFEKSTKS